MGKECAGTEENIQETEQTVGRQQNVNAKRKLPLVFRDSTRYWALEHWGSFTVLWVLGMFDTHFLSEIITKGQ
jgi:hypothetical protein